MVITYIKTPKNLLDLYSTTSTVSTTNNMINDNPDETKPSEWTDGKDVMCPPTPQVIEVTVTERVEVPSLLPHLPAEPGTITNKLEQVKLTYLLTAEEVYNVTKQVNKRLSELYPSRKVALTDMEVAEICDGEYNESHPIHQMIITILQKRIASRKADRGKKSTFPRTRRPKKANKTKNKSKHSHHS